MWGLPWPSDWGDNTDDEDEADIDDENVDEREAVGESILTDAGESQDPD